MRDWIAVTVCLLLALEPSHCQGVELKLGGALLPNNSLVDPSNINETNSLICQGEEVVWTLPNGTAASDYQINNTSLGWPNDTEVPSGLYSCIASNDSAYVGIYNSTDSTNNGSLTINDLSYNSSAHTLTCVSRGGPVTTIHWFRGNNSLNHSGQSSIIVDREAGTYFHTLSLMDRTLGQYECVVGNSLGNTSQALDLKFCEEGSLRLLGELSDAVLQICRNNVWYNVVLLNSMQSRGGDQFLLQLTATDTQITVQWNSSGSAYEVVCSSGPVSISSITDKQQVVFFATPGTWYECCVSILCNQSGRIYTHAAEDAQSCSTVQTQVVSSPTTALSILEIALIVVASVLLILLAVVFLFCCGCTFISRKKKSTYEVELREQSKHYTKQRIKLMTRPGSESGTSLHDVGSVLFNRSAQELEESHTFTPIQSRSNLDELKSVKESKRPVSTQEEAANPMYGQVVLELPEDEAENPLYGKVRS